MMNENRGNAEHGVRYSNNIKMQERINESYALSKILKYQTATDSTLKA